MVFAVAAAVSVRATVAAFVRLSDRLLRKHSSGNLFKKTLLAGNF